jgi:hypothetical protein
MAIQKHVYDAKGNAIFAETANINYFLKTELVPASEGSVVEKTSTVKAHSRRQYPGDTTPANIPVSTREYLYDPGRRNGAATPGKPFILDDGVEKRSFTFTGPFNDLHAFIVSDASMDLRLYSPGAAYDIAVAQAGG